MKRPVMVTVIGVLAILGGIAQAGFGVLLLSKRNDAQFLADAKIASNEVTSLSVALMVIGVLTVVFALGLLKGSRLMRALIGLVELLSIAASVYTIVQLDSSNRPSAIGTIGGSLIVLYFLFGTQKAKAFFS